MKQTEPTPGPSHERAIYGFFLLVLSVTCLASYIVLSFTPNDYLYSIGIIYLPQKYW